MPRLPPPSPSSTVHDGTPTPWQTASDIVAWRSEPWSTSELVEVAGYSRRAKGIGTGGHVSSETFSALGYDWRVKIYPDGKDSSEAGSGWVSVYLQIRASRANDNGYTVMARFSICLLSQDRREVPSYRRQWGQIRAFAPGDERGYRRFIEADALQGYLGDQDRFRVRCNILLYGICAEPALAPRPVIVPPSDLNRQLLAILRGGRGGDVVFSVGGELFVAHKYMVAARSSVFMAELFGPTFQPENGAATRVVQVNDMDPRVFHAMLEFIYTDALPADVNDTVEMAQHLLVAADRYDLQRLKLICEEMLCDNIDTRTAATTLTLAEQHGCPGLKEACMYFLASPGNLEAVMASDGFPHLTESCPALHRAIINQAAVSGSHVLKIVGYSETKTLGYGNCITSTVFVVGGRRWCLEYYPDGHSSEHAGWISIFVRLHRSDAIRATTAKARYEISLLALDGKPVASCRIASKAQCKFSGKRKRGGKLVERKILEESGYVKGDAFSIRCDITMAK